MMPKRIHWNRWAGKPLPANTRLVTRPGRFGNPFRAGFTTPGDLAFGEPVHVRDRDHAVVLFRRLIATDRARYEALAAELAGHDLACACPAGEPCHGDVWLELAHGLASR